MILKNRCRLLFFVSLFFVLAVVGTAAAITDATGPVISDVTVVEAGQTLTIGNIVNFSAKIIDPSGVSNPYIEIRQDVYNSGYRVDLIYNSTSDKWEGSYSITELTKDGTYMVYYIHAYDLYGNYTYSFYSDDILRNVGTFTIIDAQSDATGPVISDVTVAEAGQTLTVGNIVNFSAKITDPSGVSNPYIEIRQDVYNSGYRVDLIYNSTSDKWEGSYSITELTKDGTYMVYYIHAYDLNGNYTYSFYSDDILRNVGTFTIYTEADPYTLTVSTDGNGRASAWQTYGIEGTTVNLSYIPNNGYRFKEWKLISGNGSISGYQFTFGNDNAEVRAIFEEDVYYVSEGYGQKYTQSRDVDSVFVIKRTDDDSKTYENFRSIQMDGNTVDPQWYETSKGSLIITFKAEYMETLSLGEHIMVVFFSDGKSYISFDIEEPEDLIGPTEEEEEPDDPIVLTIEFMNLKQDGSKGIPDEIENLRLAIRIQLCDDSATSKTIDPVILDYSEDRRPVVTRTVTFNKKLDDLAPGKYNVLISGLPETVYETEEIYIAEGSTGEYFKSKYTLTVKGEINEKDGNIVVIIYLIWNDGSRPENTVQVVALPEDEIGAYALAQDGTKEYLIFQTYDICMAYLGNEELCRGNEKCYHK